MSGSLVCRCSLTRMPPRGPTSRPASTASLFSGRTPTPRMTSWAGKPLARLQPDDQAIGASARIPRPTGRAAASRLLPDSVSTIGVVISLSNGGSTWSCNSTTVVAMPRRTKFSTNSRPMKPAPNDDGLLHALVHSLLDAVHVLQIPQREDAGQVDAGNRRAQRCRSRCEDQLVVGLLVFPSRSEVADTNLLGRAVDGLDRRPGSHVELEAGPQPLRRGDEQLFPLGDLAANVVGSPQLANDTSGPRSNRTISASSDRRRARAAAEAPPATPPTMSSFMIETPSYGAEPQRAQQELSLGCTGSTAFGPGSSPCRRCR